MCEATNVPCEQCQQPAVPVHRTTNELGEQLPEPVLRGWFCASCGHLTTPIARERQLRMPT